MLCGRWHCADARPSGLMALLKITALCLAAAGDFSCVFRPVLDVFMGCIMDVCVCFPSGQMACQSLLSCLSHFSRTGVLERSAEAFHGSRAEDIPTHPHSYSLDLRQQFSSGKSPALTAALHNILQQLTKWILTVT